MTSELKAPHEQLANKVPDMKRIGRWIETDVQTERAAGKSGSECCLIGRVVNEPAGGKVCKKIHSQPIVPGPSRETAQNRAGTTPLEWQAL